MENTRINAVAMGEIIVTDLMLHFIDQSQLNKITKDIVKLHRKREINMIYDELTCKFVSALEEGPDGFDNIAYRDVFKLGGDVDTFSELQKECPLSAYTLITHIKTIARFGRYTNNRIYAAYTTAVQSLDGLL